MAGREISTVPTWSDEEAGVDGATRFRADAPERAVGLDEAKISAYRRRTIRAPAPLTFGPYVPKAGPYPRWETTSCLTMGDAISLITQRSTCGRYVSNQSLGDVFIGR